MLISSVSIIRVAAGPASPADGVRGIKFKLARAVDVRARAAAAAAATVSDRHGHGPGAAAPAGHDGQGPRSDSSRVLNLTSTTDLKFLTRTA